MSTLCALCPGVKRARLLPDMFCDKHHVMGGSCAAFLVLKY